MCFEIFVLASLCLAACFTIASERRGQNARSIDLTARKTLMGSRRRGGQKVNTLFCQAAIASGTVLLSAAQIAAITHRMCIEFPASDARTLLVGKQRLEPKTVWNHSSLVSNQVADSLTFICKRWYGNPIKIRSSLPIRYRGLSPLKFKNFPLGLGFGQGSSWLTNFHNMHTQDH